MKKKNCETSPSTHIFHFPHIIIESFKIPLYVHIYKKKIVVLCESYFSNVHKYECLVEREILLYFDRRVVSFQQEKKIILLKLFVDDGIALMRFFFITIVAIFLGLVLLFSIS